MYLTVSGTTNPVFHFISFYTVVPCFVHKLCAIVYNLIFGVTLASFYSHSDFSFEGIHLQMIMLCKYEENDLRMQKPTRIHH